jgi:hypothetical protein
MEPLLMFNRKPAEIDPSLLRLIDKLKSDRVNRPGSDLNRELAEANRDLNIIKGDSLRLAKAMKKEGMM